MFPYLWCFVVLLHVSWQKELRANSLWAHWVLTFQPFVKKFEILKCWCPHNWISPIFSHNFWGSFLLGHQFDSGIRSMILIAVWTKILFIIMFCVSLFATNRYWHTCQCHLIFLIGDRHIRSAICLDDIHTGEPVCGCRDGFQRLYDLCVPVVHGTFKTYINLTRNIALYHLHCSNIYIYCNG